MLATGSRGPLLDIGALYLDRRTARPAHQMVVVVPRSTQSVDGFSPRGMKHVHFASGRHRAELAVDGRKPDRSAVVVDVLVQLLSGAECAGSRERVCDRRALFGLSHDYSRANIAAITPTPHPNAINWITDLSGSGSLWISGMRSVEAM